MGAVRVVIELIGQVKQVEVAETVEGSDRIGVVTPAFVAWDMPLNRPGPASVEGLEEAEQVVVAFGADEPLDGADEVVGVGGIDPDVRFGMILHEHWGARWIAGIAPALVGVGPRASP